MKVKKGDTILVEYTGTLGDGTIFDSSEKHGKPLEFEAGSGLVIKGFDDAVLDMGINEEKVVHIPVEQAYGEHQETLIKKVPRKQLPEGKLTEGMLIGIGLPDGQQLPARIVEVTDEEVALDLNHPLAGKDLTFNIKVVKIN